MNNLRSENCVICNVRLDNVKSKNVRTLLKNDQINVFKLVKKFILSKRNKLDFNQEIVAGKKVCNRCILDKKDFEKKIIEEIADVGFSRDQVETQSSIEYGILESNNDLNQQIEDSSVPMMSMPVETNLKNQTSDKQDQNKSILNIRSTYASHRSCFICKNSNLLKKLTLVPKEAIVELYIERDILIPFNTRCCRNHLDDFNQFKEESKINITVIKNKINVKLENIQTLNEILRSCAYTNSIFDKVGNIGNYLAKNSMKLTGFSVDEIHNILQNCSGLKKTQKRNPLQALFVYLFWLRTGMSQDLIAVILEITQQDVSRYCYQVREALFSEFVPENLGPNRLARDDWLLHNTEIVKNLFQTQENQLFLIADGTYCYVQKSSCNRMQRMTYSMQKKRHLVKPFVICSADGLIVDIYGPYAATINDASIIKDILQNNIDLKNLICENDVFLLDRGFRDCVNELKSVYSLNLKLPLSNFLLKIKEKLIFF